MIENAVTESRVVIKSRVVAKTPVAVAQIPIPPNASHDLQGRVLPVAEPTY